MFDENKTTTSVENAIESIRNANGEPVNVNRQLVYNWSVARKLLAISDDKLKRACRRNRVSLKRKPYSYHSERPEDVKSWVLGLTGTDLIVVAADKRSNPEWEEIPSDDIDKHLGH